MTTLKRNEVLFNEIADAIEARPDLWKQNAFMAVENTEDVGGSDFPTPETLQTVEVVGKEIKCGTTQCIAGWAVLLSGEFTPGEVTGTDFDFEFHAQQLLGLNASDASRMFYGTYWIGDKDADLEAWTRHTPSSQRTAELAAARLREIGAGAPVNPEGTI